MQAIERDGFKRDMELYDHLKVKELLDDPKVKEVRVFRLQKGMKIKIEGTWYKVTAARPNGKVTMRPVK